jgi:K+-sensing histidine kinase KdpD
LLHLLALDEAERLSSQGQEYVQRLQSVAGKISGMTHFLREMVRIQRQPQQPGDVVLGRFLTELKGELHRHLPEHTFTWEPAGDDATVFADRRLLLRGVAALIQTAAAALPATALRVGLSVQPGADASLLRVAVSAEGVATPADSATTSIERRLEFALARETLALAGITCRLDPADRLAFVLTIPHRSVHG